MTASNLLGLLVVTPFMVYVGFQQEHKYFRYGLWAVGAVSGLTALRVLTQTPPEDTVEG